MSLSGLIRDAVNRALRPFKIQLIRSYTTDPAIGSFLSARKTAGRAKRAGLTIGDYIDRYSAEPGATSDTVAAMLRLADLGDRPKRVCEVGAGSGRYARVVVSALRPDVYEIYETAPDWLPHLRGLPGALIQPADGHSLSGTATASIDLVHAHKLFVYIPFVITAGYLDEMARVVRPGGAVAFDIITEKCTDRATTDKWIADNSTLYNVTPRDWAVERLAQQGLSLVGSRLVPLSGGHTELLVFRR